MATDKIQDESFYDLVLEQYEVLDARQLSGDVLIKNVSVLHLNELLRIMRKSKLKKLRTITLTGKDYKTLKKQVKSKFKIIKAAGGLVVKDDQYLMIYRLKRWDLPKGKLDDDEKSPQGAVREVEEECNIKVFLADKLCTTWHTYVRDGKSMLKKTKWYVMYVADESGMKPQLEEDIEDIRWMNLDEVNLALENSYYAIREVFGHYFKSHTRLTSQKQPK